MNRLLVSLTICTAVLGMAVSAAAQDRTWTGAGVDKNWSTAANWNGAVGNPHNGRLIFTDTDLSSTVFKIVDANWDIGGIRVLNTTGRHMLDLSGNTLSIFTNATSTNGDLYVRPASGTAGYLAISNGTLSITRDLLVSGATLALRGATLSGPIRTAQIGERGAGGPCSADLRGVIAADGLIEFRDLYIGRRNHTGYLYLDNTSDVDTLKVTGTFSIGLEQSSTGRIGWSDPARNNEWYLPVGLNLVLGDRTAGAAGRGKLWVGTTPVADYAGANGRMIVDTNGTCDAWLSELHVGHRNTHFESSDTGTLNLRRLDAVTLDATEVRVGTCLHTTSSHHASGYVYLPAGTARVDRLYMGDDVRANAVALLDLSGTTFQVDERMELRDVGTTTTELYIRIQGKSCGLDLAAGVATTITGLSKIRLVFEQAPAAGQDPYWGIRHAGDKAAMLGGLLNAGTILVTKTFTGAEDYKTAVWYDSGTDATYVGLVDAEETVPAVVAAKDIAVEASGAPTTRIGPNDIYLAAYHPGGLAVTGRKLSHPDYLGGAEADYIDFATSGTLPLTNLSVTLTLTFSDDSTATDTADVVFVAVADATTAAVTWSGGALWQYLDRREWQWGGNWLGYQPPANPTAATVTFSSTDTSATKVKLLGPIPDVGGQPTNVWTVGSLRVSNTAGQHLLDLGGKTLRTTGEVRAERATGTGIADMTVSNGTITVGTDLVLTQGKLTVRDLAVTVPANRSVTVNNSGVLTVARGATLSSSFATLSVGLAGGGTMDGRGGTVPGGVLDLVNLRLGGGNSTGTFTFDTNTLHTLFVRNQAHFNAEGQRGGALIGEQVAARGNQWFLPAGTHLRFGTEAAPGELIVGYTSDWTGGGFGRLAATGGGTCEAWLTALTVGHSIGGNETPGQSRLLLNEMDAITLRAVNMNVGIGNRFPNAWVSLPFGTAVVGTLTVGESGSAVLELNDTHMVVTNALTAKAVADIRIKVGASGNGGLDLPTLPTVLTGGKIAITFQAPPAHGDVHYGLKIEGNVQQDLEAAVWLSWNDDALTGRKASVFVYQGDTYVGVPPSSGTVLLIR